MATNSKQKGSRGEREAAKLLRDLGYEARRSQQYQGVSSEADSADLIHSIPGVRLEIKFGYDDAELGGAIVNEWVEVADNETPDNETWIILWRKTRKKWMALLRAGGIVMMTPDIKGAIDYSKG